MSSISLADQLEDALTIMIAEPNSAPPKVDLPIGDLLKIATELLVLPDPRFKAALKANLLGHDLAVPISRGNRPWVENWGGPIVDMPTAGILPTLVGTGDGGYPVQRSNFAISLALHVAMIMLIVAGLGIGKGTRLAPHTQSVLLSELVAPVLPAAPDRSGGGGGGGDDDKMAASRGAAPRFAREQISPPAIVVRNEHPNLAAEPTLVGPPSLPPLSQVGNPFASILLPSNGTGIGGGIGSGSGGGVGSGSGPGFGPGQGGGTGGGTYRVGGGVSAPKAIYAPDPEYSDEARRAKYQGSVLLWLIVGADGRPRDIRVARSLGMGLDEKAIEAVRLWRFEPSLLDGRPVAVQVNVEVSFQLY